MFQDREDVPSKYSHFLDFLLIIASLEELIINKSIRSR